MTATCATVPAEHTLRTRLQEILESEFTSGTGIEVLENGDQIFPSMLEAIENAEHSICFLTYVYWEGEIAELFANTLARKAGEGVKCYVLLDAFGSQRMHQEWLDLMRKAGVTICRYNPFSWSGIFEYQHRMHRKILTCDETVGFVGGVGVAEEWSGHAQDPEHWHDFHFRIQGPIVADLVDAFTENWTSPRTEPRNESAPDCFSEDSPNQPDGHTHDAILLTSSPKQRTSEALDAYKLLFAGAKHRIRITSAYLIPDKEMMRLIRQVRDRGVKMEIIIPGEFNDSTLAQIRTRSRWKKLLKMGVRLHIYRKTMCHAKVLIVDDEWVSIGSINFDLLSLKLNEEANLIVHSKNFANEMLSHFEKDRKVADELTLEEHQKRGLLAKLAEVLVAAIPAPWWTNSADY